MFRRLLVAAGFVLALCLPASAAESWNYCWNPNATSGLNQWVPCNSVVPLQITGPVTATQGTNPWVSSITLWGGGTLGAMANYGSSPGPVLVPGVNSFITNTPSVNQGTSPWVTSDQSNFGAAISSSVTRVANTTTYTANTGWCNTTSSCSTVFSWAAICRANGTTIIIPNLSIYSSANPTTKLQGILWLFSVTPGTVINDDATFNIAAADFANLVGGSFNGIPFTLASSQASGAANSGVSLTGLNYEVSCAGGSTTLYGMVQVVNAYVPASGEVLTVRLHSIGVN